MDELIARLKKDFPRLNFEASNRCFWSPKNSTIFYNPKRFDDTGCWAVLHELGHSILGHSSYNSDIELLMLEVEAWEKAQELAPKYSHKIDPDHIQNCLDTYREWLHRRSTCPKCHNGSVQQNATTYSCFNCQAAWKVSSARFCRPYRKIALDAVPFTSDKFSAAF